MSNFGEKSSHYILLPLIFLCYYCSINLKRQSNGGMNGVWGMIFIKKFQILEKKFSFYFFHLIFLCYNCCSINLKKQSEHSGLRPVTSSLVSLSELFV